MTGARLQAVPCETRVGAVLEPDGTDGRWRATGTWVASSGCEERQ
ncbi:hypothetical protein [Haladaptatus sp. T7]|nr:hypothetical protein [Haladaptatus sp. T7]